MQFTPDLLPADLTGTEVWRPRDGRFEFQPGPIFHSILLADEINRAPAKVQSALLEAMGERQVTVARWIRVYSLSLESRPVQTPEEIRSQSVSFHHVTFRNSKTLTAKLSNIHFSRKENVTISPLTPEQRREG